MQTVIGFPRDDSPDDRGGPGGRANHDGEAVARADSLVLVGQPVRSDLIEADVSVDGTAVGHIAFRDRDGFEEYTVRL